jgi:hypothetical protein
MPLKSGHPNARYHIVLLKKVIGKSLISLLSILARVLAERRQSEWVNLLQGGWR